MRMIMAAVLLTSSLLVDAAPAKRGGFGYPPQMEGARVETYKTIGDVKLNLWIFSPAAPTNAPAIVFFFGGGWSSGSPAQFEVQCRHLARRGMVAITADYRVATRHQVKAVTCLTDARSALRWVRAHAAQLGVDPNRIAAGGGSAGGHLAAATAFISQFDDPADDKKVSATPNALVLFNPALMLAALDGQKTAGFEARVPEERLGTKGENLSPVHHVASNAPPAIIFHGRADSTVPFATAEAFAKKMKDMGNRCELVGAEGQPHGFFNRDPWQAKTLDDADKFLVSLGWLQAQRTNK